MSIASRIQEIETHLENDWTNIEALGGSAEDRNIENIAQALDDVWENLPHTTGTGTSLSLNTKKGKAKVDYSGNTSQFSTTGKQLFNKSILTYTNGWATQFKATDTGVEITYDDGSVFGIYIIGNLSDYLNQYLTFSTSTTPSSKIRNISFIACDSDGSNRISIGNTLGSESNTLTTQITGTYSQTKLALRLYFSDGTNGEKLEYKDIQVEVGQSKTSYEPYTNGASPNPTYPQTIHSVSGNNTITTYNSDNSESTSYPINLGDIELNKIGTYKDGFVRNTGKNLFDKDTATYKNNYIKNDDGNEISSSASGYLTNYIAVLPNTTYTLSGTLSQSGQTIRIYYYDNSKGWISRTSSLEYATSYTFTTPTNCYYMQFQYIYQFYNADTIQIEKGNTATPYEPYGNGEWYLKKEIGKIILNGSETGWGLGETNTNTMRFVCNNLIDAFSQTTTNYLCSNFQKVSQATQGTDDNENLCIRNDLKGIGIRMLISRVTDLTGFKTWLSNNNTEIQYILNTPTYTKLTNTTLINQLENAWRSNTYDTQTNISQVNNDLPFELDFVGLSSNA